ncbi:MAG: YfhO family protein, partial [Desulfuromonadaceae bacterium]|nr:YfhO family protein [Desulfuromonadaceae bacterium]
SHILFTNKVIRAPDILNEYYWSALGLSKEHFWDFSRLRLLANWDIYGNSGNTLLGGGVGTQFVHLTNLVYYFFPLPSAVAWFIVLHFYFGAVALYLYCRLIGVGRIPALLGGLVFALAPEMATLINAGHVLKVATISIAPWAFYFLERGFRSRRAIFFLTTGVVLAFQFFYTHWQIAYYTCLGIGVYGIIRYIGIFREERNNAQNGLYRLFGLNLVTLFFFLSTVAISLAPLAQWSQDTNRGAQSGANQGKGGLQRDEAMSWSLPPEELAGFIIPGFFGFSRQEAGENPSNIGSYYWGRMNFTQTISYMGLLPWLLLPLPLIFRRDRYTWIALAALVGGIIFSMGKYTVIYQFLFDYFPGINRFRVPKMIMFLPVMGLAVMAARGLELLLDNDTRQSPQFKKYCYGLAVLALILALMLVIETIGKSYWINTFIHMFAQPTRYQQGEALILQRWHNLVAETGIAACLAAAYAVVLFVYSRSRLSAKLLPLILIALFLVDVWRVNAKFMFLVDVPHTSKGTKTSVVEFLGRESKQYRILPMNSDPSIYTSQQIPVMFVALPVQQVRWQQFLDDFVLSSAIPDMMNVKYLVYGVDQYMREKAQLGDKFQPVFQSNDGQVVLENRTVLPKGWLVPSAVVITDARQRMGILQNPEFNPKVVALVETPPPFPLEAPGRAQPFSPQSVTVTTYEGERIAVSARVPQNALLVLGEKYFKGWKATVDGKPTEIYPVNTILRGVYLQPGSHDVVFVFDPLPFKIGKWLTLLSFAFFSAMLVRELLIWKRVKSEK